MYPNFGNSNDRIKDLVRFIHIKELQENQLKMQGIYEQEIKSLKREIENLKKQINNKEAKEKKKTPLTVSQKVLFFHYLQLFKMFPSGLVNKHYAEVLSELVNLNEQNIRKALGRIDECKTIKNLEAVKKQFEKIQFSEIVNEIDNDIKFALNKNNKIR